MSDPIHAGTFVRPISGALARVLAEAANSGFAPTFYVVCRYEPDDASSQPYDVRKPCPTYEDAKQLLDELERIHPGVPYGIFGPFASGLAPVERETVGRFLITPRRGGKDQPEFPLDGDKYDALFYSLEAVNKFVVPYYAQVYGPQFATKVVDEFITAPLALMGHLPWSEEAEVVPAPQSYIPVLFERDASGAVQPRPLHPPARGER